MESKATIRPSASQVRQAGNDSKRTGNHAGNSVESSSRKACEFSPTFITPCFDSLPIETDDSKQH